MGAGALTVVAGALTVGVGALTVGVEASTVGARASTVGSGLQLWELNKTTNEIDRAEQHKSWIRKHCEFHFTAVTYILFSGCIDQLHRSMWKKKS